MKAMGIEPGRPAEIEVLSDAFTSFNAATQKLQHQYRVLKDRMMDLDIELQRKNRELEMNLEDQTNFKNYFQNILESLNTGVIVLDLDGEVITFNEGAETITGFRQVDVLGNGLFEAMPGFFESGFVDTGAEEMLNRFRQGEGDLRTASGEMIRASLNVSEMKSREGEVCGIILLLQDISEIKKLKEQALRNDRLVAMGEMAASIAHEVRNPLCGIELYASMLRRDLEHDEEKAQLASRICSGVGNLNCAISNLLIFTRSRTPEHELVDLHGIIENSMLYAGHLVSQQGITLNMALHADPPEMMGDRELLKQVMLNFILNAGQAMPEGGSLDIETRRCTRPGEKGRDFVEVHFSDSGCGIDPENLEKIFNPFFTTKAKGTGLGLTIVNNIIKSHDGRVEVDSRLGHGTRFVVVLPVDGGRMDDRTMEKEGWQTEGANPGGC